MSEFIVRGIGPAHIDMAYEVHGDADAPVVLLIMGLAAQLIHWPDGLIDALTGRGFQVVRFDNRDAGLSTHMTGAPIPDFPATMAGDLNSVSYTLSDMAADAVGLLDALGVDAAHVVGASMGGAIAQMVAIEHPQRVRSLTSMMFTTGNPGVGKMHPETGRAMFAGPPAVTRDDAIARALCMTPVVRSPRYPAPQDAIAATAGRAWDRDHHDIAPMRQGLAVIATGDRTERLQRLDVPALVIHGSADTVCDPSGGLATAEAIPGARFVLLEGMGHDLPAELHHQIASEIAAVAASADAHR